MSPTGPRNRSEARGFTFLELLVVVTILGIFAASVSVRVQGPLTGGDLRSASRRFIGEVKRFRGKAAYTLQDQVMGLKIGAGSIRAMGAGEWPEEDRSSRGSELPEGVFVGDVVTQREDAVEDGVARIRFFRNGCVEPAVVYLRNTRDEIYTLEINPITGAVRVHDRYVEKDPKG